MTDPRRCHTQVAAAMQFHKHFEADGPRQDDSMRLRYAGKPDHGIHDLLVGGNEAGLRYDVIKAVTAAGLAGHRFSPLGIRRARGAAGVAA